MTTNNLKTYRIRADLGQKEVAAKLSVSVQTISYWENGSRMPTMSNLKKLAELYNATIDQLLGVQEESKQIDNDMQTSSKENSPTKEALIEKIKSMSESQLLELRGYISGRFGK